MTHKEAKSWKNKKETETSINNLVRRRTRSVSLIATFIEWKMKERRKIVWFCSTENFGCNKFLVIYHFCEALVCYWKTFCQKQQFFVTIMKAWCMKPLLINELVSWGGRLENSFAFSTIDLQLIVSISERYFNISMLFHRNIVVIKNQ